MYEDFVIIFRYRFQINFNLKEGVRVLLFGLRKFFNVGNVEWWKRKSMRRVSRVSCGISPAGAVVVVKRRGFNDLRYTTTTRERDGRSFQHMEGSQRGAGAVNAAGVTMATNKSHGSTNDNNTRHTITGEVAQAYTQLFHIVNQLKHRRIINSF